MNKSILRKLGLFLVIYISGIALCEIPFIRKPVVATISETSEIFFNIVHSTIHTNFSIFKKDENSLDYDFDYSLRLYKKADGRDGKEIVILNQSAQRNFIVPFIFAISLLLVGPGGWRRKLMVGGLLLLFIIFTTTINYTLLIGENAPEISGKSSLWYWISNFLSGIVRTHEAQLSLLFGMWAIACLPAFRLSKDT